MTTAKTKPSSRSMNSKRFTRRCSARRFAASASVCSKTQSTLSGRMTCSRSMLPIGRSGASDCVDWRATSVPSLPLACALVCLFVTLQHNAHVGAYPSKVPPQVGHVGLKAVAINAIPAGLPGREQGIAQTREQVGEMVHASMLGPAPADINLVPGASLTPTPTAPMLPLSPPIGRPGFAPRQQERPGAHPKRLFHARFSWRVSRGLFGAPDSCPVVQTP